MHGKTQQVKPVFVIYQIVLANETFFSEDFFHYETEPDWICGLGAKSLRSIKHIVTTSDSQNLLVFVDQSAFDIEIKAKLIWRCLSTS